MTDTSSEDFIRRCIKRGHEAIIEHFGMTVRFTVDRGVSHEIIRHRIASFAQESTRYCNYSQGKFGNEITVIDPCFFDVSDTERHLVAGLYEELSQAIEQQRDVNPVIVDIANKFKMNDNIKGYWDWYYACKESEKGYLEMLRHGCKPEQARSVLPNSLKTRLIMTANMREWRHFLNLRAAGTTGKPHPQMLEVAVPLLNELREKLPALFDDIQPMDI